MHICLISIDDSKRITPSLSSRTARFLEMISGEVWVKLMELFVAWKIDDEIGRPAGLPSMWQSRNGCEIGSAEIVITKKREGTRFQSWTKWMPGVNENTLSNRNAVSLCSPSSPRFPFYIMG
jgi:hypothetical protein